MRLLQLFSWLSDNMVIRFNFFKVPYIFVFFKSFFFHLGVHIVVAPVLHILQLMPAVVIHIRHHIGGSRKY